MMMEGQCHAIFYASFFDWIASTLLVPTRLMCTVLPADELLVRLRIHLGILRDLLVLGYLLGYRDLLYLTSYSAPSSNSTLMPAARALSTTRCARTTIGPSIILPSTEITPLLLRNASA